jgi:hypothetical protein
LKARDADKLTETFDMFLARLRLKREGSELTRKVKRGFKRGQ